LAGSTSSLAATKGSSPLMVHLLNVFADTLRKTRGIFIDVRLTGTIATRNPYVCRYSPTNVGEALVTFSNRAGSAEVPTGKGLYCSHSLHQALEMQGLFGLLNGHRTDSSRGIQI